MASNIDFVIELYNELQGFPAHKKFGLTGHLQRAAVSIPSNIAEEQKNSQEGAVRSEQGVPV